MPITGQIPIEFSKLAIPHVSHATSKSHGGYGSMRVMLKDEKLQEKSSDSGKESNSKNNSYKTIAAKSSSFTTKEWITICILSIANLGSTSAYSCIAPFYSNEVGSMLFKDDF
ncbi:hypothetical protein WUBG_17869 [Wuchereria bancrofti]|uniref:Uncharacterized protein n=1 Tax=Wuchereria bancrofti TaxID=6293 RepID=J9DNL0_WUCBA|nr:hypothetical protein WUBG_17869 [Wuchereria bancrofti]